MINPDRCINCASCALGVDISDLPVAGSAPEWYSEKAAVFLRRHIEDTRKALGLDARNVEQEDRPVYLSAHASVDSILITPPNGSCG